MKKTQLYRFIYDCDLYEYSMTLFMWLIAFIMLTYSCGTNAALSQEECAVYGDQGDILPVVAKRVDVNYPKHIRCVVHILHDEFFVGSEISQDIVEDAIGQLNVDFEGTNISFELMDITYTDMDVYPWASGYRSTASNSVCFPNYGTHMAMWTNDVRWNTAEYCNIYVAPDFCSTILGFAWVTYIPYSSIDGVWVETEVFGTYGEHLTIRDENETLTHEMGHYCGLHHVFRDGNGIVTQCGENIGPCDMSGDFVCDTPPTKVAYGCPGIPGYFCPEVSYNGAQYFANNHMDYCAEECRDVFTEGQIERMHAMLDYQRFQLFDEGVYCFGDLNNDCIVGTADMLIILSNFGCEFCSDGDLDLNYVVNTTDLMFLLNMWGQECGCEETPTFNRHGSRPEDTYEILKNIRHEP
jgi:hypothetical protein